MPALLLAASYTGFVWVAVSPAERVRPMIALGLAQSVAWLFVYERRVRLHPAVAAAAALVAIVLARSTVPLYEDDYYRYVWDGFRTLTSGEPYRFSPSELTGLEAIRSRVRFPEVTSVYPATAQWLFAGFFAVSRGNPEIFLWLFTLSAAGLVWLAMRKLTDVTTASLFVMHPLIVKEWWQSCHFDSWLVAVLIYGISRRSSFWMGVGGSLKVVSLPVWLVSFPQGKRERLALLSGLALPWIFLAEGFGDYLLALTHFGNVWEMNSGVFRWLRELTGSAATAKMSSILLGVLTMALVAKSQLSPAEKAFWVLFGIVMVSPVANSWYFTWSLPFALVLPERRRRWALIAFVILPLSYWFYVYPRTESLEWAWNFEHAWLCACGLLATPAAARLLNRGVQLFQSLRPRPAEPV